MEIATAGKARSARFAAVLLACAAGTGAGMTAGLAEGVEGSFGLAAMVHTPDWPNNAQVAPWDGKSDGEYIYRAIPCSGNAPLNNISSNLPTYNGLIPTSRSPASTRSNPFKFTVQNGKMAGSISLTVCSLGAGPTTDNRPDADRDRISIDFTAETAMRNGEETTFAGAFNIRGGTGRYSKLAGSGAIRGYFICFDPAGCAAGNKGKFRDMQYVMEGRFNDPSFKP